MNSKVVIIFLCGLYVSAGLDFGCQTLPEGKKVFSKQPDLPHPKPKTEKDRIILNISHALQTTTNNCKEMLTDGLKTCLEETHWQITSKDKLIKFNQLESYLTKEGDTNRAPSTEKGTKSLSNCQVDIYAEAGLPCLILNKVLVACARSMIWKTRIEISNGQKPDQPASQDKIEELLKLLGNEDWQTREKATEVVNPNLDEIRIKLTYDNDEPMNTRIEVKKTGANPVSVPDWKALSEEIGRLWHHIKSEKLESDFYFIIDAESKITLQTVVKVIDICRKVGIEDVRFAAKLPP